MTSPSSVCSVTIDGRMIPGGPALAVARSLKRCDTTWPSLGDTPRLVEWHHFLRRELAEACRISEAMPDGWEISLKAALARVAAVAIFGLEAEQRRTDAVCVLSDAGERQAAAIKSALAAPRSATAAPLMIRESDAEDLILHPRKFDTVRRCASCLQTFMIGEVFGWDDRWFCCREHELSYLDARHEEASHHGR